MTLDQSAQRRRRRLLADGPWSIVLRDDELAEIAYDGRPVLRGIRAVVRNHNWLTLTPEVRSVVVHENDGGVACRVDVAWAGFGTEYRGTLGVHLDERRLKVRFDGVAPSDISSNRIGLVVLHRPDDAGRAVVVGHSDGTEEHAAFPHAISPHQPFKDIASLAWDRDGVRFKLAFLGDVFETEDQRNWTDASFKTYGTPLSKPFPVLHTAGSSVCQSVELDAVHLVQVGAETMAHVPEIAVLAGDPSPGAARGSAPMIVEIAAVPRVGDGTLSVEDALRLLGDSRSADVRIVADSPAGAVAVLERLPLDRIRRLAVFDPVTHVTAAEVFEALRARAQELGFHRTILTGTRAHFTELNRNAALIPFADGIAYSITSQMHAVEPEAVMESLALQAMTARLAHAIGGGPVHVGPITIAPRFNAVATEDPRPEELPTRSPLEGEVFGAAWLLGSIAALTLPGVASLSYAQPEDPLSPMAGLLRRLSALHGADVLGTSSTEGGPIVYAVRSPSGVTCFLANPRAWALSVRVTGPGMATEQVSVPAWGIAVVELS